MSELVGQNLVCVRGDRIIFKDLNFAVSPGEIIRLVGKNGCGKSTFLHLLGGLVQPIAGTLSWQGATIKTLSSLLITPHSCIKPYLTVEEHLSLWASLQGLSSWPENILKPLELHTLRQLRVSTLSFGQCQRLSLARLSLASARLWLLDEPFSGLDRSACQFLEQQLEHHSQQGGIVVFADHREVYSLAHYELNVGEEEWPLFAKRLIQGGRA